MKNRMISVVLSVALAFSLAGCSGMGELRERILERTAGNAESSEEVSVQESSPTEEVDVGEASAEEKSDDTTTIETSGRDYFRCYKPAIEQVQHIYAAEGELSAVKLMKYTLYDIDGDDNLELMIDVNLDEPSHKVWFFATRGGKPLCLNYIVPRDEEVSPDQNASGEAGDEEISFTQSEVQESDSGGDEDSEGGEEGDSGIGSATEEGRRFFSRDTGEEQTPAQEDSESSDSEESSYDDEATDSSDESGSEDSSEESEDEEGVSSENGISATNTKYYDSPTGLILSRGEEGNEKISQVYMKDGKIGENSLLEDGKTHGSIEDYAPKELEWKRGSDIRELAQASKMEEISYNVEEQSAYADEGNKEDNCCIVEYPKFKEKKYKGVNEDIKNEMTALFEANRGFVEGRGSAASQENSGYDSDDGAEAAENTAPVEGVKRSFYRVSVASVTEIEDKLSVVMCIEDYSPDSVYFTLKGFNYSTKDYTRMSNEQFYPDTYVVDEESSIYAVFKSYYYEKSFSEMSGLHMSKTVLDKEKVLDEYMNLN